MEFSRQEYWIGLPFPYPVDLPDPGIDLVFPARVDSLPLSHQRSPLFKKKKQQQQLEDFKICQFSALS